MPWWCSARVFGWRLKVLSETLSKWTAHLTLCLLSDINKSSLVIPSRYKHSTRSTQTCHRWTQASQVVHWVDLLQKLDLHACSIRILMYFRPNMQIGNERGWSKPMTSSWFAHRIPTWTCKLFMRRKSDKQLRTRNASMQSCLGFKNSRLRKLSRQTLKRKVRYWTRQRMMRQPLLTMHPWLRAVRNVFIRKTWTLKISKELSSWHKRESRRNSIRSSLRPLIPLRSTLEVASPNLARKEVSSSALLIEGLNLGSPTWAALLWKLPNN